MACYGIGGQEMTKQETKAIQYRLFWLIARGIDQVPKDSNYIDERLEHRVHNLAIGFNLLGKEVNHE